MPVTWFQPKQLAADAPVLVYLHGGSFIYGSDRSHGDLCARLALASSARVAFVHYRLAPEHLYPAAIEDVGRVYLALLASGIPAQRIVMAGDSAGGNLVLASLMSLRDQGRPLPAAAVPISPWVDVMDRTGSMVDNERYDWASPWMFDVWAETYLPAGTSTKSPLVSPLYGDFAGLCPLLVVVGSAELLFDQVSKLVDRARAAGVVVEQFVGADMIHAWMTLAPMFPHCQLVIDHMGEFVRRRAREATLEQATAVATLSR